MLESDPSHDMLLFQPLESAVDATFWSALGDLKLDSLGLSEDAIMCHGTPSPTAHTPHTRSRTQLQSGGALSSTSALP
jgi:hypothetical protein